MLKITLISMGNKMPNWVQQASNDFSTRLQDGINFTLIELPLLRRGKTSDNARILEKEMQSMKHSIPSGAYLITLDIQGESYSSEQLAHRIRTLTQITSHLCFLIGGPEGLASELVQQSNERWSLSKLTLPHTLARVVLIEALYRAWSILQNHPYHK